MFEDHPVQSLPLGTIRRIVQLLDQYSHERYKPCPASQFILKMLAFLMDVIVSQASNRQTASGAVSPLVWGRGKGCLRRSIPIGMG